MLLGLIRPSAGETRPVRQTGPAGQPEPPPRRRAHRVVGVRARTSPGCEPAALVGGGRRDAGPTPTSRLRSPSPTSAPRSTARSRRTRRACASGSASPACCWAGPRSSCSTSPRTASTRARCARCASSCAGSPTPGPPCCSRATCSPRSSRSARHAVVMDKGKLVAAGSVVDLIGTVGLGLPRGRRRPAAARGCSRRCRRVHRVDDEPPGLAVDHRRRAAGRPRRRARRTPAIGVETVTPAAGSRTRSSGWSRAM